MQNSMVMFAFFCFKPEITFWGIFVEKTQECLFKLKFDFKSNSNVPNSMVMFTFFYFRPELPFLSRFGSKNQNSFLKGEIWDLG